MIKYCCIGVSNNGDTKIGNGSLGLILVTLTTFFLP